jgi:hypothetical protein
VILFEAILTVCEQGVIGCINHSTFTWTPPQDPTHTNEESNVAAQYDLPPPHDFPEYDRKRLDELLNTPLPSFARFLRHCPSTFQHYFPKTFDKDREKMYHRDDQMVKAAEEERMERWEELKALKQLQNKKTTTTTSSSQDNQAQASKGRKRTSQDSTSLVEDNMVRNNKRARTEQGSNTGSVVASSILDVAPTAPYHRHRHQFGLNSSHERSTSRSAYPSLEGESASIIQTRRSVEVDAIDQLVHEELSPVNQNWKMFASRTTLTYSSYPFKTPNSSLSIATMPDVFDHDGTAGL